MSGTPDALLRTALKALLEYAPARCPTAIAYVGEPWPQGFMLAGKPRPATVCAACRQIIKDGQHAPDCAWMRARSVIGAIRSYQRGNR